jgi:conjugal transfer pilus assembly protein TraK
VDVTDGGTVTVQVSARELTRVGMADDRRIARVWGLEDRMSVEADTDGGQVFIRPVQEGKPRPFSFFVRDDQGATYTLVAVPVDMPADAVVLRPRPDETGNGAARGAAYPYVGRIKSLARDMANGAEPPAYTVAQVNTPVPVWHEARVTLARRYAGDLTGEVYRLTNTSEDEMRLDERELGVLAKDVKAIAIVRHALAPGESTVIYLLREAP